MKLALSVIVVFALGHLTAAQDDNPCPVVDCAAATPCLQVNDLCASATCENTDATKCCPDTCNCEPFWLNADGASVDCGVDPCALVLCAAPNCPDGYSTVIPEGQCCPVCRHPVCSLPQEPGICLAAFQRYWYDQSRGVCTEFTYGGCGGNANNFETLEECMETCNAPTCPANEPQVSCLVDPCSVSMCPNFLQAVCVSNYCGGCRAWFFDASGNNVTDRCIDLPTPLEVLQCPALPEDAVGVCVLGCSSDSDCDGDRLCCSTGCGQTCQTGVSIPYYEIPLSCPVRDEEDIFGTCVITEESCLNEEECELDGQLCCRAGCGRTCQTAIRSEIPCFEISDTIRDARRVRDSGIFEPQCSDDGYFAPVQCFNVSVAGTVRTYCWCVHTRTGVPSSLGTQIPQYPTCTTCQYEGETYYLGQSFPSSDGCNECFCGDTGDIACTEIACVETCQAPPEPGVCRGADPRYYFDYEEGTCKQFTYGGCGGNENNFFTVTECLEACAEDSPCLLPAETGLCLAYFPSYFFNTTSNRCEQFVYGGCGGNENRFSNGEECLRACDPDGDYLDHCLDILCDEPVCPPGSSFVPDGTCCGGFCSETECRDDEKMCIGNEGFAICVSEEHICDVIEDCAEGEDERGCPSDCENGFLCGSRECLPQDFVCDDYVDCRDRSDEQNCVDGIPPNTWYISDIPRECPATTDVRVDCEEADECRVDGDCDDVNEICCSVGCDTNSCVLGHPALQRCRVLRRRLLEMANGNAFVPNCESDGSFSPRQCFRGFCWCVDIQTGFPLSEGVRDELPVCLGCQLRADDPASLIAFGETYIADDGCNVCDCVAGWPENQRCTNDRCPGPCQLNDVRIEHQDTYEDDCIVCECAFGALDCKRRDCTNAAPVRQPVRVTMPFDGDFESLIPNAAAKEELEREIQRTLLILYRDSLGLKQDQIQEITTKKGSVLVTVVFVDSENTTDANVTVLLSQLEQDYSSGYIVIRFGNDVLEPSGSFQVGDDGVSAVFPVWVIAVIVVAAVAVLVAVIAIIIAVVVCCKSKRRGSGPEYDGKASPNGYDNPVTFTSHDEMVKVPLD